ncbi:phosphocholine cytidylyltransferase family protein [Inconstantimicrobium mannanitabidum]|uniref:Nucleotidyltransferase n=1 Tax=Inconstantimicrobium mannanitabidum TaxID=1604901 RepID=A0ACB5RFH0_9CLOT|nr:phosphocholine cytidylyltransferase family protein [Clostridium sp. TW13]GKX67820.1 nucleotidyltransferase [Clostridium sp. TW13]
MRALILAAGRGTRISRYLSGRPKCTVDIGGETLIEHTVKQLRKAGINEIGIIVGYNQKAVREILREHQVSFFYNPFFDVTNSIASAWFADRFIKNDDDIIIMNGDVFIENSLLDDILNEKVSPVLFSDSSRKEQADYKFYYEDNILKKYGKELSGKDVSGEYIGIARIGREFIDTFKSSLDNMIEAQQHSLWWENALYELSKDNDIYVRDVAGKFWAEVDYIEDYERILKFRNYDMKFNIDVCKHESSAGDIV